MIGNASMPAGATLNVTGPDAKALAGSVFVNLGTVSA